MNWWMLRRRVHASWLIAGLCFGVMVGVILAQYDGTHLFQPIVWCFAGLGLAALSLWRKKLYVIPFVLVAGCLIGLWRGAVVQVTLGPYEKLVGTEVTLRGVVREDPEMDAKRMLTLHLAVDTINGHTVPGTLWVTTNESRDIKRGDIVTLHGEIQPGFSGFAGSMYRAKITSVLRPAFDPANAAREWFGTQVRTILPENEAALGIGFLTGQKQGLSPELDTAMRTVGLTHIVVASGYNLTILVRLARRLFVRVSKYLAALSGAGMIAGFMAITGMSPSMSRAGLVAGLSLAAWYYGRKFHPLVLLPFTAAVTLLINPTYGWNDLGWQLSFMAFAGVMIVAPLLQAYFFGSKKPGLLRQVVGETVAAQLVTLPILIGIFGQFSSVALIANVLVVPLVPAAMLLTFLTGVTAPFLAWFAELLGWLAEAVLAYMIGIVDFLAALPWAVTSLVLPVWAIVVVYIGLVAGCVWIQCATKYDLRTANLVE